MKTMTWDLTYFDHFICLLGCNIGIIHILFAGSRGSRLNSRPLGREFKLLPRDPANFNALKQTRLIVSLAFYMIPCKLSSKTPEKS